MTEAFRFKVACPIAGSRLKQLNSPLVAKAVARTKNTYHWPERASPAPGISNRPNRTLQIIPGLCSGPIPRVARSRKITRLDRAANVRVQERKRAIERRPLNRDALDKRSRGASGITDGPRLFHGPGETPFASRNQDVDPDAEGGTTCFHGAP